MSKFCKRLRQKCSEWHLLRYLHHQANCLRSPVSDPCDNLDFHSGHCSGTMSEVAEKIRQQIGWELRYNSIPKCRSGLLKYHPKREDLPIRSMKDSFTTALLPLGSDGMIREHYVNHLGRLRMGRMMEQLDIFAVWVCHRHVKVPNLPKSIPLPYTFVTLVVESVEFLHWNHMAHIDLKLCGHVSWTGKSSMEIIMYLQQKERTIAKAIFIMVARNATNTCPAPVNPLNPANEQEELCLKLATDRRNLRRSKRKFSIFEVPPTKQEEDIMYDIFTRTKGNDELDIYERPLPTSSRWMSTSFQNTILHLFPENLNSQNTIFGGYIMRNAIEVSFITASIYTSSSPLIKYISDVMFLRPVRVNSFLKLSSYVVYTFGKYMQLMTIANVMDANTFEEEQTNVFYLIYEAEKDVPEVLPRSYPESLWYINGRRQFHAYLDKQKEQKSNPLPVILKTTEKENDCS
ncbi:acyl-coenzyme A thioesterase 9, mitochondrial-like [Drosophila tropicalis]|uniref:acyl-coenzyme A thioesterase 9, mitochondrial-like n=1 Tax=Drosophila tropicalis TaxID=46794 RepID=UPI0035AB99BF